jgi:REP element-mobilizing transposase RayT
MPQSTQQKRRQPMNEIKKRRIEWSKQQEKKPSMKRRCDEHDYTKRGIYMITMATEGRLPLFGTLKGDPMATSGNNKPHVVLSPLGEKVKACWLDIHAHCPEVSVIKLCIMPDHIHGVLFVRENMPHHLGTIINGFKSGTRKAARELGIIMPPVSSSVQPTPSVQYTEALPQLTKQPLVSQSTKHPVTGVLWESGYNDRILLQEGQLQRMLDYLDDNPRRLLLKRASPQYFKPLGKLTVAGISLHVSALARDRLLQPFWKRNFPLSSCS